MLAALKKEKTPSVIIVDTNYSRNKSSLLKIAPFLWFYAFWKNFRVLRFKKYPWFRVEKLSRFDDLEFPKAENFAKMTEKRVTRVS